MSPNTVARAALFVLLPVVLSLAGCTLGGPEDDPHAEGPPVFEFVSQAEYDCAERVDTGYVDGNPFEITVVSVDAEPVERETANAYIQMQTAAAADGVNIRIVSGFRTMAEQEELYACYVNCNCNNCNLAARPGHSNHQSGHALDLNTASAGVLGWLNARGGDFGFSRTVPSEDWHWEWWGGGPGGGPCLGIPCPPVPAGGDIVDDGGPCFELHGPAQFWRSVDGEGHGGGLHWTNAFTSDSPDNWARWRLEMAAAGDYQVEVLTGGPYGLWAQTRYGIGHAGASDAVVVNQSAVDGWQALGVFHFEPGGGQFVDVYDDFAGEVPADQHIRADAVRVTPFVPPPPPDAAVVVPPADAGTTGPVDDAGGSVTPGDDGGGAPGPGDAGEGDTPDAHAGPGPGPDPDEPGEFDAAGDEAGEGATPGDDAGAETPESGSFNAASPRSLAFRGSAGCQGVAGGFDARDTGLLWVLLPLVGRRLRKKR